MKRNVRLCKVAESNLDAWYVDDEKEYALDHPNEIVGVKYYFEGIFTHYNNGYGTRKAEVICINGSWFVKQIY
jgi:hypothetical protein